MVDYVAMVWRRALTNALRAVLLSLVAVPSYAQRQEPGTWLSGRGGPSSDGASSRRLGWDRIPEVVGAQDLKVGMPLDYRSVLAVAGRGVDCVVFVNDGSALMAYDTVGRPVWRTDGVGVGELLDVADLDGDGRVELLFSALQRLQFDYNAATGPGRFLILDAQTGNILWTHQFEGLAFGFNRRRTLVASVDGGRTRSIFGVLTYSPSLWRIDYSRETGGRVTWKSAPLVYNSPDAAPHVTDLDGDGQPEIVVDSNGHAYALDGESGIVLASDTYADHHSFSGFLGTAPTSEGPVLFDLSNSGYGKSVAAFRFDGKGGLRRLWSRTWDSGLDLASTDLSAAPGLVQIGGQSFGVWSVAPAGAVDAAHVVQAVHPASGAIVFTAPLGRLIDVLDTGGRSVVLVTTASGGVRFSRLSQTGITPMEFVESATWSSASRGRTPSQLAARPWASTGLLRRSSGDAWLVRVPAQAIEWQPVNLPPSQGREHAIVADLPDGALLLSGGGAAHAVGRTGVRQLFARAGALWATPIIGQLDEDAGLEVVVPYGDALARFDFAARHAVTVTPFTGRTLQQERETFHIPAIAASDVRVIVSYERADDGAKLLVGRNPLGVEVWRHLLDQTAGELTIVTGSPRPGGGVTVFQHDNHGTRALDARTGRLLWRKDRIGQCQRQIAAVDWNRDGVDDVAVQSGDVALVLDGRDGRALFERPLAASYGAYVAIARTDIEAPVVGMVNAGGLGLFDTDRVILDALVQPRGLEMIPLVVGPWGPDHRHHLFMATGSGLVSVVGVQGATLARRDTGLQILTATGAFVDNDETLDLLVSTMQGELVALAGSTLTELWRLRLGGLAGPAVATDVDADGTSEVIVVASDGRLLVIAPRVIPELPEGSRSGDTDGDGMTDQDEQRFGLSRDVPDALLDADGDGVSNADEIAAGTHPRGLWTAYLPGGVTSTFFGTAIAIANPSTTSWARVLVRLQGSTGRRPAASSRSRRTAGGCCASRRTFRALPTLSLARPWKPMCPSRSMGRRHGARRPTAPRPSAGSPADPRPRGTWPRGPRTPDSTCST
jgi:outer membrane protein assembly factor BamB